MESRIEDILTVPIHLTDTLRKVADEAGSYRQECAELKSKAEKLAQRLRAVARVSSDGAGAGGLYRRPMRRIMQELEKSLDKALVLVRKCKRNGMIKRVITITTANDFKRVNLLLDNAIGDITWLLTVSASGEERADHVGLPPIASMDPMLAFIWEHIALLQRGNEAERTDAAMALASVAKDNDRNAKIIVEEDGVVPMLKLLTEGNLDAREAAARALGYMARDENVVNQMVKDGSVPVFVKVLTASPMKVQARVAWALAEMVALDPGAQDHFLEHLAIRPLVGLLAETLEEPSKVNTAVTMHTLVTTSIAANKAAALGPGKEQEDGKAATHDRKPSAQYSVPEDVRNRSEKPLKPFMSPVKPGTAIKPGSLVGSAEPRNGYVAGKPKSVGMENGRGLTQRELNRRERENEDPQLKAELKAEVARALWMLAKGNPKTSKSITETKALLCFATLMEHGRGAVQLNSVMAVMEIAAAAEHDVELRRTAFKTSSQAAKVVVEQLLRLVEEGEPELQVPCIKAIGCLARTFPARETRVVKPLVMQLEGGEAVAAEAVIALEKFACTENYLHMEHSRAIIEASGATHLVQLIYFGEGQAKISAVILMCYLALHVGESEAIAKAEALQALEWAAKHATLSQHPTVQRLLPQAIGRLEIFQAKGVRDHSDPFHHQHF